MIREREEMPVNVQALEKNVAAVRAEIDAACRESGRTDPVTLVAAVKYTGVEQIRMLRRLGVEDVGENRVQQLLERYEAMRDEGFRIHFIGKLQTNKVKYLVDKVCMIHSVDSLRLAEEIEKQCAKSGLEMDVLVEINSGMEEAKSGVDPSEAADLAVAVAGMPHLHLRGFMTMGPKCASLDEYRKYFSETSRLALDIWTKKLHNISKPVLSMGMSDSFPAAIAEGATVIRVGGRLFAGTEDGAEL